MQGGGVDGGEGKWSQEVGDALPTVHHGKQRTYRQVMQTLLREPVHRQVTRTVIRETCWQVTHACTHTRMNAHMHAHIHQ